MWSLVKSGLPTMRDRGCFRIVMVLILTLPGGALHGGMHRPCAIAHLSNSTGGPTSLGSIPQTLNPDDKLEPKSRTIHQQIELEIRTRSPKPETLNRLPPTVTPQALSPYPYTLNPKP